MLKRKRILFLLGTVMAVSLIFAACGSPSTTGSGGTPTNSNLGTPGT